MQRSCETPIDDFKDFKSLHNISPQVTRTKQNRICIITIKSTTRIAECRSYNHIAIQGGKTPN